MTWLVIDSTLNFISKKNEWKGTKIIFEIFGKDNKTLVVFNHIGLSPSIECYEQCSNAWKYYINTKLQQYIMNV